MRKIMLGAIAALFLVPAVHGQAVATATRRALVQVGVEGSAFSLDYGEGHEEGIAVYGDYDFTSHLGVEAEYRNASIITPHDIGENHILVGPRFHLERGRFFPYAKLLVGQGTIVFQQGYNATSSSQSYLAYAIGGGLDYHLKRHINIRAIDFEYHRWPGVGANGLTPYGISVGAAYNF